MRNFETAFATMNFEISKATEILERTPFAIEALLHGLSGEWTSASEGEGTWSPYDVLGHLIHGEKTDWIPRVKIILSENGDKHFTPFDMAAHFADSKNKSLQQLLDEFKWRRAENVSFLRRLNLTESDLQKTGIHPELGVVTLKQHLASWTCHDLAHIAQIVRVMAKQYKNEVGPWIDYLSILKK
jgi:hypothetical protein